VIHICFCSCCLCIVSNHQVYCWNRPAVTKKKKSKNKLIIAFVNILTKNKQSHLQKSHSFCLMMAPKSAIEIYIAISCT
jgi:disulfide oxidoreductase YuzD